MSVLCTIKNQKSAQNKYEPKSIDVFFAYAFFAFANRLCIAAFMFV